MPCFEVVSACGRMQAEDILDVACAGAHARSQCLCGWVYGHKQPHACLCKICNRFMSKCPQVAEKENLLPLDEVDETSSYGSGHSSEGVLEPIAMPVHTSGAEDIATVFSGIAALARGQDIVVEKLSFLEKIVGTLQFDMTWVRDDMKSVHQAMDRFADYVGDVEDEAAEAQRLKEQVSLDGSPHPAWKGKEVVVDFSWPPSASTSFGEQQHGSHEVADRPSCGKEVGNSILETLEFDNSHDTVTNKLPSNEMGRRDWGYEREASPELGSPHCQQTRATTYMEPPEEESQQIEMLCQSTQLPTPTTGRGMWEDFTTAVRDWRAPNVAVTETEEGWVSAKKGRWDLTVYGKDNDDAACTDMEEDHASLNLNLPPEKEVAAEPGGGEGRLQ